MNQKKKKMVDRGNEWERVWWRKKKKRMDDIWCEGKNNIKNKN